MKAKRLNKKMIDSFHRVYMEKGWSDSLDFLKAQYLSLLAFNETLKGYSLKKKKKPSKQ